MTTLSTLATPLAILRQTEKAVQVDIDGRNETFAWLPKSQIEMSITQFSDDVVAVVDWLARKYDLYTKEQSEKNAVRREAAFSKYEALVAWAKENNLPVRNRMKKATIIAKATDAGLTVPAHLI